MHIDIDSVPKEVKFAHAVRDARWFIRMGMHHEPSVSINMLQKACSTATGVDEIIKPTLLTNAMHRAWYGQREAALMIHKDGARSKID